MAGTGNLILKRGTKIPFETQLGSTPILLKGMPAVQLNGLSQTTTLSGANAGPYAYKNYANRLWIGLDSYGDMGGTEDATPETISGAVPHPSTGYNPVTSDNTRPLWMGAEIRAFTPVGDLTPGYKKNIISFFVISSSQFRIYVSDTTGVTAGQTISIIGSTIDSFGTPQAFDNLGPWTIQNIGSDGSGAFILINSPTFNVPGTANTSYTSSTPARVFQGDGDEVSTQYTILKADWDRPSDLVLCTQQAIAYAPNRMWAQGSTASRKYVEFYVPEHGAKSYSGSISVSGGVGTFSFQSTLYPPLAVGTSITINNAGSYDGTYIVSTSTASLVTFPMPSGTTDGTDSTCNLAITDPWSGVQKQRIQLPTEAPVVGEVLKVTSVFTGDVDTTTIDDNEYITWINTEWGSVGGTGINITSTDASTDSICSVVLVGNQTATSQSAFIDGGLQYDAVNNNLISTTFTGALAGNATSATTASQILVGATTTAGTHYLTFVDSSNTPSSTAENIYTGADLSYNPSTKKLTAGSVNNTTGAVTGGYLGGVKLVPTPVTDNTTYMVAFSSATSGATDTTALRYSSGTSGGNNTFTFNPNVDGGTLFVKTIRTDNLYSVNQLVDNKVEIESSGSTVELNASLDTSTAPSEFIDYGLIINRGNVADAQLRWNETTDRWEIVSSSPDLTITGISVISGSGSGTGNDFVQIVCTGDKRQIVPGQYVQIRGITGRTEYNGEWKVHSSFPPTGDSNTIRLAEKTLEITSITSDATKLTVVHPSHFPFAVGQTVTIRNTQETAYNGTWTVTGTPTATQFELAYAGGGNNASLGNAGPSNGGTVTGNVNDNYSTTSINLTNAKLSSQFAYPIVHTSAPTDNASPANIGYTLIGGEPIQTIYNAKLVDVELNNLTMTGFWNLQATITATENLNLSTGGLILPYVNNNTTNPDSWHENNPLGVSSGNADREGQIAYDIASNTIKFVKGTNTNSNAPEINNATNVTEIVDLTATQTLINKTLTAPVINNSTIITPNLTLSTTASNTAGRLYYTTSGGSNNNETTLRMGRGSSFMEMVNLDANQTLSNKKIASGGLKFAAGGSLEYTIQAGNLTASQTITLPVPTANDTFAVIDTAQSLSNKTLVLTANNTGGTKLKTPGTGVYSIITQSNSNSYDLTIPTLSANDTFAFTAATQTFTNKTFTDDSTFFQDNTTNSKKMQFQLSGISANNTRTLTIGDWDGTVLVPTVATESAKAAKWLIESTGTASQPKWVDPDDVVVGGVKLRKETNSTNRYPLLFGASTRTGTFGNEWSSVAENSASGVDVFLMADWDGSGEATEDEGLYYSPGESMSTGQLGAGVVVGNANAPKGGTLYAGFFAGYLDCGTY